MVIGGVALLTRKRFFMSAFSSIIEDKGSRFLLAAIDIIFGLFVINLHNDWSTLPAGIVTFVGWAALAKGVISIFTKDAALERFATKFKEKKWYFAEGIVVIVAGLYLVAYGFNIF
jgi:uncharacterized membrane protein HdeD (DUF308 family)